MLLEKKSEKVDKQNKINNKKFAVNTLLSLVKITSDETSFVFSF